MKISKLSALAMLLASYLPSLSLNAKTLIVDDFLKYQDTSNMHFDFAKPNTGLTPYESQFYLSLNSNDAYFNFSDDDIYKKMIKIKGEEERVERMDAFEARRHKNNFYDAYVNEYKSHLSEVKSFFSELDSVEIRNVVFAFNMRNYDVNSELYSLPMSILERRNGIVFNDDSLVHEDYNTSFLRNSVSSHYFWSRDPVKSLSFKIPVEIAEYLYHNDGAIILNVKMNVKINVDCIDNINYNAGNAVAQTRADCIRKNKRVLPLRNMSYSNVKIDIVEKNDLYNSSAIEHLWEILYLSKKDHSRFLGREYDVDMNTVLKLHNDRNIIYSTDKVSVEYSSDYKYSPLER